MDITRGEGRGGQGRGMESRGKVGLEHRGGQ